MDKDCIVIGGGLGGLFTGALLAVRGCKVTVLEKNASVGGGLQCFVRGGEKYETGMHVAGGFERGAVLDRLCRYLGLRPKVAANDALATVFYLSDSSRYDLPCGRSALTEYLISRFPSEAQGIESYMEALYTLSREEELFYLKPFTEPESVVGAGHSPDFLTSASGFIAKYVNDTRLRSLLAFLAPLYAGERDRTPAFVHIMASVLLMDHPCRFDGGSDLLAEDLASVIRSRGGEVITRAEVVSVEMEDRRISSVATSDGKSYSASSYISDIHPLALLRSLPSSAFPKHYSTRLKEIPLTASAFKVYIRPSQGAVPFAAHPLFVYRDYGSEWKMSLTEGWPQGVACFMTPSADGKSASHLSLLSTMDFSQVEPWADGGSFRRGEGYAQWKDARMESLLELASSALPSLSVKSSGSEAPYRSFAASPLTFRDWYGTERGSSYGFAKDYDYLALSHLSVRTRIPNLFLTGQNVNLHGIGGVPMTAIETAEAVEGNRELREEISRVK
jgi:all-trans-retinol 13,14-reductase